MDENRNTIQDEPSTVNLSSVEEGNYYMLAVNFTAIHYIISYILKQLFCNNSQNHTTVDENRNTIQDEPSTVNLSSVEEGNYYMLKVNITAIH